MNRKFWLGAAVLTAMLGGCAQEKEPVTDDFSALAGMDEKSDIFSTNWRLMGSMSYGQTSASVTYTNPPRYRAFKFAGAEGDKVDVWVRSTNGGDSVAWVLNDSFAVMGSNDDASSSNYDSHIVTTLGANVRPGIVTYYVVFRDYDLARANFKVTLRKTGSAGCNYDGTHYNEGQSFPSTDGCNTCSCGPTGGVACTKRACINTCDYGGTLHNVGDSFPSTDGCNTCSCTSTGVACTERACAPSYNKKYMYTPSQCQLVRFVCAPGTSYFSDAMGCGCEQPSDCPEWINCQPPTDCSAERARCPLSQIAW